ncbi:MAG: hypothetical protein WCP22_07940 [Chlamydiota bacterium]
MGLSFLIHPVTVEVRQIDPERVTRDAITGDVTVKPGYEDGYGDPVALQGQVHRYSEKELSYGIGGLVPIGKGFVLFDREELEQAEVTLATGDIISSVEGVAKDFRIVDVSGTATYGGQTYLVKAVYDEAPKGR